jgi:aminoglycoside 3-N-acetyltransferase
MIGYEDIISGFKELGITEGDVLLVHSSFKSFGGVEGGPQTVIKALLDVIGKKGTLVMPTFNFSFCEEYNKTGKGYFDADKTPSNMGILTELVRKMPGVKRSAIPIYSVAVYGHLVDELSSVSDHNVFGKESIFGKLHRLNAKILIIGLTYNKSFTFVHYVEQQEGCDYRHPKDFTGYIVANGRKHEDTFTMLVRDLDKKVLTSVDPMGEVLEKQGVVKIKKIGQSVVKVMKTKDVYDIIAKKMKNNPRLLYSIGD